MVTRRSSNRNRRIAGLLAVVLLSMIPLIDARAQDPTRFEADIQAFESIDRVSPPPADPVLFVGSSSIRMWTDVAAAFPDYPVMNRGFGGSYMSDLLYYFDRVVAVYDPALILVYEGDNDLAGGKSVDVVYSEYVEFLAKVKRQLPAADVAFIAVKPSPSRLAVLEAMRQLNARLEALAENDSDLWFIDVFTPMLDGAGQPRAELFGSDMLHMNATGYALWKNIVGAMLDEWSAGKGQSFLFDFGPSDATTKNGPAPDDPANYWNNVTDKVGGSATGSLRGLVNTRNRATSLMLRMVSPFNGSGPNRNGTTQSTVFPANATQDSLYGNTADWQGFANVTPSFKLVGLDPERTYNFTFYASRMGAADIREADYTATGFNSASTPYDAANNVDGTAVLVGIIPDAEGAITISLAPTDRNNNAYRFVYLGAMRMDEIPQQQPVVFVKEPADQTVEELRPVTFAAAVDSTPPYTIQWFKNGQPIRDANEFTYTIDSATLDLDGSVFSVKVSNELYSATSRQAVLHVIPDVNVPALLSVEVVNGLTLRLTFDERLDPISAAAIENYRVNGGQIAVAAATLEADGLTVTLTLATPVTGAFDVAVLGVRDLAGNEIVEEATGSGEIRAQVILVDFGSAATPTTTGPSPDDPANAWNNVTDAIGTAVGAQLRNLVTTENVATSVSLVILNRFGGANTNGTLASPLFPADATRDSLFGNTETFNGLANVFPSFKLTGLDPMRTYDFTFYASRLGVTDNRETGYTVTGFNSGFIALNAAANVDKSVTLTDMVPTAAGEITISLAPTAANNNANHFTYLGVLKIEPTPITPRQ
ncbi:MAG TPA: GDSL-type esterase/lipase family protein [Candidatus Anammoximicrobium sp.]|nr:GDSL-type esterase/lipase family protein [Candidatus Anammoximicrobium sp.]